MSKFELVDVLNPKYVLNSFCVAFNNFILTQLLFCNDCELIANLLRVNALLTNEIMLSYLLLIRIISVVADVSFYLLSKLFIKIN